MLVACITGPDLESAKKQLERAEELCDAVEIRRDLIRADVSQLSTPLPRVDCGQFSTYHDFQRTPDNLDALVDALPRTGLVKVATQALCVTDALRMLDLVRRRPYVVGMCMGSYGALTRILAPVYGSLMTFAAVGPSAAPGQLQARELVDIYRYRELSPSTKVYGLLGNPVSQSPSHKAHNAYFAKHQIDAVYVKMQVETWELPLFFDLVKRLDFKGLSVTIPFKERLFDYVDRFEGDAGQMGAINTLTFDGERIGSNTDAEGALAVLERRLAVGGKRMVILGSGGSAKAIAHGARLRRAHVSLCSRRLGNFDQIPTYDILVNTTPVDVNHDPIPKTVVFDINFQRQKSRLMATARRRGCRLIFGEELFQAQAALQFARWGQIPSS